MNLQEETKKYEEEMIAWRRDFHSHPELGFDLFRTSEKVANLLTSFGLEVKKDFAQTAVLGILKTGKAGKTVAIRADMDALGMQDLKDVAYHSQNPGCCHACGHDSHTALLLGLAKYLSEHREALKGTVKFLFQPAEEGPPPGGAKLVLDSGVLDDVDIIIGAHAQPLYQAGQIGVKYGAAYASGDFFEAKIIGAGCHAASPHKGKDVIVTAMQIIEAIQNIRARELPPLKTAVISVCSINAGKLETKNVLPSEVTFGGTFRAYEEELRQYMASRIEQIVKEISSLNGCECEFKTTFMYPSFSNDPDIIDCIYHSAVEVLGSEQVIKKPDPEMGSEDFAYYTQKMKAAFFFFGIASQEKDCVYGLHNPRFNIDESTFAPTLAVMVNTVLHLL